MQKFFKGSVNHALSRMFSVNLKTLTVRSCLRLVKQRKKTLYRCHQTNAQPPLKRGYVVYRYEEFDIKSAKFAALVGLPAMFGAAAYTLYLKRRFVKEDPEVLRNDQSIMSKMYNAPIGYTVPVGFLFLTVFVGYLTIFVPGTIIKKVFLSADRQTVTFVLYNTWRWSSTRTVSYPISKIHTENHKVYADKSQYYITQEADIPNPSLCNLALGMYKNMD